MNQNDVMARLQRDPDTARLVMQSPDGQALLRLLSGPDGGAGLRQAMAQASGGDTAQLAAMLRQAMASPEGAALIRSLGSSLLK